MKSIIFIIVIFFSNFCFSQANTFIRVYDLDNHKIAKGHLQNVSDSSILITKAKKFDTIKIHYSKIGSIRLKRSFGHTVGTFALTTSVSVALFGLASTPKQEENCIICFVIPTPCKYQTN